MHLVFIPVVHTKDKKGNDIDKIACSEFWKEKDSYRQLQDAFYNYMVSNNFVLARGNPTERVHLSVEDFKQITNFENSKTVLQDINLELPDVPDIKSFGKLIRNRDEKIQDLIIAPKDKMIKDLQEQNTLLTFALERQVKTVERASKYEKERKSILAENRELKDKCETMENDYFAKLKEETKRIEDKYENKIYHLENENNYLRKIINTLKQTLEKVFIWISNKLSVSEEDELIRKFEADNNTYINPEKQIEYEEEQEYDFEV